jgi:hypothetical protein
MWEEVFGLKERMVDPESRRRGFGLLFCECDDAGNNNLSRE